MTATSNGANDMSNIVNKITEEKGKDWAEKYGKAVAGLVYYHYLESEDGQRRWHFLDYDGEDKVEDIFDSIHDNYVNDLEWMTEEEWQTISEELYNMVYEGVF